MSGVEIFDTHAHLDDGQFESDLTAVIERAIASGVTKIVAVGTTLQSSRRVVEIAEQWPTVHAAVGIHPNNATQFSKVAWNQLVKLAEHPEVVAIGETGLDRYRNDTPFHLQEEVLRQHIDLAQTRELPLVIHCRDAEQDILHWIETVTMHAPVRGIMHAFSGETETAKRCVDLGLYISFAGQITFRNRKFNSLRETAKTVPLHRILIETDSPFLSPEPLRGRRNEPAHLRYTAEQLAAIWNIQPAKMLETLTGNARKLFAIDSGTKPISTIS